MRRPSRVGTLTIRSRRRIAGIVRPLATPEGFIAPHRLTFGDLVATPIDRSDLDDDVAGINANLDLIARTRGGGWPTAAVTRQDDYVDLVWHELEFREGYSYTYVLRRGDGVYVDNAYLYPIGRRVRLDRHPDGDVDVSWWVTRPAYARAARRASPYPADDAARSNGQAGAAM